jgi:ABC-type multidrug transport system permease subunit
VLIIEYYKAKLIGELFAGIVEYIMLHIWFGCVVVGAIFLYFMNKTKFNKLIFWIQIILSSLLLVSICYDFIKNNFDNTF